MNENLSTYQLAAHEAMEARFARSVTACLSESAAAVSPDVGERLRFAREKALAIARVTRAGGNVVGASGSGAAILGFSRSSWWIRFASVAPLLALVGGLVLIQDWQSRTQISVAAEVDEALLGDDLPINAYRDPGFSEYLKTSTAE